MAKRLGLLVPIGFLAIIGLVMSCSAAEMPQFKSGISEKFGISVDFNELNSKANSIYEVIEQDNDHIIWTFADTTGDFAFVDQSGMLTIASTTDANLVTMENLRRELNEVQSTIKLARGTISGTTLPLTYYTDNKTYRSLQYEFNSNFDLNLKVPNVTTSQAKLTINGMDSAWPNTKSGQHYYIDGVEVSGCDLVGMNSDRTGISCGEYHIERIGMSSVAVEPVYIPEKISPGLHSIAAEGIDDDHTLILEVMTSLSENPIVLYSTDKAIWQEDTKSKSMKDLYALILPTATSVNTTTI